MTLNTNEEVLNLIQNYDKQAKALKQEVIKMCWYMRGGINYEEAMQLSNEERQLIGELVKENVEITKKSGLPFF